MRYKTRYTHAIHPSPRDVGPDVDLGKSDLSSSRALAAALRRAGVLTSGARVKSFRIDRGGKIVLFPGSTPSGRSIWWSVTLTPIETRGERAERRRTGMRVASRSAAQKRASGEVWMFPDGKVFYSEAGASRHARRIGAPVPRPQRRGGGSAPWRPLTLGKEDRAAIGAARRRSRARHARRRDGGA